MPGEGAGSPWLPGPAGHSQQICPLTPWEHPSRAGGSRRHPSSRPRAGPTAPRVPTASSAQTPPPEASMCEVCSWWSTMTPPSTCGPTCTGEVRPGGLRCGAGSGGVRGRTGCSVGPHRAAGAALEVSVWLQGWKDGPRWENRTGLHAASQSAGQASGPRRRWGRGRWEPLPIQCAPSRSGSSSAC